MCDQMTPKPHNTRSGGVSVKVPRDALEKCRRILNARLRVSHSNSQLCASGLAALAASLSGDLVPVEAARDLMAEHLRQRVPAVVAAALAVMAERLGFEAEFSVLADGRIACTPRDGSEPFALEPLDRREPTEPKGVEA